MAFPNGISNSLPGLMMQMVLGHGGARPATVGMTGKNGAWKSWDS
jgi:hypothetical protein